MCLQVKSIQIGADMVPGFVSGITNKKHRTFSVSYKKPAARIASRVVKGICQEDLVMMLECDPDECDAGGEDDDEELADWCVKYTVVKGCQTVRKISEKVGVSPASGSVAEAV